MASCCCGRPLRPCAPRASEGCLLEVPLREKGAVVNGLRIGSEPNGLLALAEKGSLPQKAGFIIVFIV